MRNEDRHRYRGHQIRIPDHVWDQAEKRAKADETRMRDLIHGWLAAYAAGNLAALRIADNDPAHEGGAVAGTVKLFAISMATVGCLVSETPGGAYRKVVEVERFGDIYRVWLEPVPGDDSAPEYLDGSVHSSLWQPHTTATFTPADEAREARKIEEELDAAAEFGEAPSLDLDPGELNALRERGLA